MSEDNFDLTDRKFPEGHINENWLVRSVARINELKESAISHARESAIYLAGGVGGGVLGMTILNHPELLSADTNSVKLFGLGMIAASAIVSGGSLYEGFRAYQDQSNANALTVATELAKALSDVAQPIEERGR